MSLATPNPRKKAFLFWILMMLSGALAAQFAGGTGTLANPYLIQTPEHLNNVRNFLSAHFAQIADIDMQEYLASGGDGFNSGSRWLPIGTEPEALRFYGTYDGRNHVIQNLMISRPNEHYIGLFGFMGYGSGVKNLGLLSASVSGGIQVGCLIGGTEYVWVDNCYVEGTVNAQAVAGVFIGNASTGTGIYRCFSKGSIISSGNTTGGLVGSLSNYSLIENSYSHASVQSGGDFVGGFCGMSNWYAQINTSYSTGAVSGMGDDVGGFMGRQAYQSTTTTSFWDLETSGVAYSAAGSGLSTQQMKQQATFTFWDFNLIWNIQEGRTYPYFAWQNLVPPAIHPASGLYYEPVVVILSHPVQGASIFYRSSINGGDWSEWIEYDGIPFDVPFPSIYQLETYAEKLIYQSSLTAEASFETQVQLTMPEITPAPGSYNSAISVELSSQNEGAEIRYTLDGSLPTQDSHLYEEPLPIVESTVVKACAFLEGWAPSEVLVAEYIITTSVDDETTPQVSAVLYAAYPNPFNPSTTLSFHLEKGTYAELSVFNARGQRVRNLIEGFLSPGFHSRVWDGTDDSGMPCSSGIYYYTLRTHESHISRRMTLIK